MSKTSQNQMHKFIYTYIRCRDSVKDHEHEILKPLTKIVEVYIFLGHPQDRWVQIPLLKELQYVLATQTEEIQISNKYTKDLSTIKIKYVTKNTDI